MIKDNFEKMTKAMDQVDQTVEQLSTKANRVLRPLSAKFKRNINFQRMNQKNFTRIIERPFPNGEQSQEAYGNSILFDRGDYSKTF